MRLLILDKDYPDNTHGYSDGFVESRALEYKRLGHEVSVLRFFLPKEDSYARLGISVACAPDLASVRGAMDSIAPDVIMVHFFQGWMLKKLFSDRETPLVVWVHGVEALGFWRRLFNLSQGREFLTYAKYNLLQLPRMRRLLRATLSPRRRIGVIFVSKWMKRVALTDTLAFRSRHKVIPNPISVDYFAYHEKPVALRHSILLIRSFSSRKYATDLACAALTRMLQANPQEHYKVTIIGSGHFFEEDVAELRADPRVEIVNRFLTHEEIRDLHAQHGVFLCPTRQDAQGVSMCEAMASGLVPIASRSTAIPEFVRDGQDGFLTRDIDGLVHALTRIAREPATFAAMSASAASHIRELTNVESIARRELEFVDEIAGTDMQVKSK